MKPLFLAILACLPLFAVEYTAVRATAPIHLDGVLDEAAWQQAQPATAFRSSRSHAAAVVKTEARFAYDDSAVYIGVRAHLGPGAKTIIANDRNLFAGECVEIMLDPGATRTRYLHFLVNPNAATFDEYRDQGGFVGDPSWDALWEARCTTDADGWTAEVRIPFASLEFPDGDSLTWAVNIARSAYDMPPDGKGVENSSISQTGAYHTAGNYPVLVGFDTSFAPFAGWGLRKPAVHVSQAPQGFNADAVVTVTNSAKTARKAQLALDFRSPDGRSVQRRTASIEVAAGATAAFPIRGFHFDAAGVYRCEAALRDAVTKRTLLRVPYAIPLDYQMLSLKLDAPHYKGAIFATMNLKEVRFRARAALPADRLKGKSIRAEIRAEIRDEAGKTLAAATLPAAPETAFAFPAAPLPEGRLAIHATLLDEAGKPLADATRPLRKLPYKKGEVWVDTDGMLVRDGQRIFFLSQWCGYQDFYDGIGMPAFVDWKPYKGSWLISPIFSHDKAMRKIKQKESITDADRDYIRQALAKHKDLPDTLCYLFSDEPEVFGDTVTAMEQIYSLVTDIDPYHPLVVSNDTIKGFFDYQNTYDLQGLHAFPRPARDRYYANFERLLAFCDSVADANASRESVCCIRWGVQGFDYTDYGAVNTRVPAFREFRSEYYIAVITGVTGVSFYDRLKDHYPELGIGHFSIAKEFIAFAPALAERAAKLPLQAPRQIRWLAKRHNGHLWLFVANASGEELSDAALDLPELAGQRLRVMCEGRTVKAQGGRIRDRFTPWQVHVYTTDPAFPEPYLCAEVEAAINRANAARQKPGNLAFQKYEGVSARVTASSNKAFNVRADNCLWHLVDGVIEPPDFDHYISHYTVWSDTTPNQCPDWVELAFDNPVTASRVVLYPAYQSLKDYQIQIWKDGKWQTVAEARDAQGDTHTLAFPAATFSRLRVFITANRGRHSRLREIELYR